MVVVCPSCAASYRLDAAALGIGGRTVRCAACRTTWFVGPAATEDEIRSEAPPATPPPRPELHIVTPQAGADPDARPTPRVRRRPPNFVVRRRRAAVRPATAVVLIGCTLFAGAMIWRRNVVAALPQAAPLYAAVGLPVNLRGLTFRDVTSDETVENGTPVLHISGRIANISGESEQVPRLRLAVRGNKGREIYVWTAVPAKPRLAPGESLPFTAELAAPPAEGREVAVRFLTASDLTASLGNKSAQ
jgi:predicted Zn finger-like uncharacterized protein